MPMYTFTCSRCDKSRDELFSVSKLPKTIKCTECGGRCKRDLRTMRHVVRPDTYPAPRDLSSIMGGQATSRTDTKRAMDRYDRKYGTKLTQDI